MAVDVAVARRLFTRDEYHRMGEAGILKPTDRVELIRGEIVKMAPIGRRHRTFTDNLVRLLVLGVSDRAVVAVPGPIVLADDTEPEPDVAIYRRRAVSYKDADRGPDDALLLIEVAETSLACDRSTKLRLYAAAGIAEYWVVDCAAEAIEVYRDPEAGGYREVRRITGAASVSPQAFPDVVLNLSDIFA